MYRPRSVPSPQSVCSASCGCSRDIGDPAEQLLFPCLKAVKATKSTGSPTKGREALKGQNIDMDDQVRYVAITYAIWFAVIALAPLAWGLGNKPKNRLDTSSTNRGSL